MEFYGIDNSWTTNYEVISPGDEYPQSQCYACSKCNECVAGKEIVQQNDKIYCWKCFEIFFGHRCVSCLRLITGLSHMNFIFYNNQVWHKECFYCSSCWVSLEGKEFRQAGRFAYCRRCSF